MAYPLASPAAGAFAPPDDLIVTLNPLDFEFAEFLGSRALLEAEGLIPQGTAWPQGYADLHWRVGRFNYWLRRERPPGVKGPRSAFVNVDWFSVRQTLANGPSHVDLEIARAAKELKDVIYRRSARGQAESDRQWQRYLKSNKDAAFQNFKAAIPGLVRRKRVRSRRVSAEAQAT